MKRYLRFLPRRVPNPVHASKANPTGVPMIGVGMAASTPSRVANVSARPLELPFKYF